MAKLHQSGDARLLGNSDSKRGTSPCGLGCGSPVAVLFRFLFGQLVKLSFGQIYPQKICLEGVF
jgi:hypothetical protein